MRLHARVDAEFGGGLDGKNPNRSVEMEQESLGPFRHRVGSDFAPDDSVFGSTGIDASAGVGRQVRGHRGDDLLAPMGLGGGGFVKISAESVIILVKDQSQVVTGLENQPAVFGDNRNGAIMVAAIQVEPIGIRAFVVNQTPWVQAWKNPKFQAP